jgi:two-component system cell cycle sensor histidine kinase/response regulator CckA
MFTSAGIFEGYIGSCIDITDLKRAQEENFHRQKMESIGVLAAGIAHDFNNLLSGILAHVQLVEDQTAAHSPLHRDLRKISTLGLRASEIVRELMVYAGHETNGFETLDLSTLVGEMLELLRISISKRVVFKTSLANGLPPVGMQPSRMRQVVMNLVTNASEAIGDNEGVITVASSLDPAAPGCVRLEVSDTGCGMTAEQQTKIFDPFFTTKFVGRGLGLAVVLGVVRTHGGSIALESSPGRGTTFRILLPCAAEAHAQPRGTVLSASS